MVMKDPKQYSKLLGKLHSRIFKGRKKQYWRAKGEIKRVIQKAEECIDDAVNAMYDRDRIRALAALARYYARGLGQIRRAPGISLDDARDVAYSYGNI
ncbi:hypothetical protein KY349_02035, partial [Candidatus Woesearchaeota archaeon]|nr:hypothetical protein [Candidatus Woesearchaeota archaeon]